MIYLIQKLPFRQNSLSVSNAYISIKIKKTYKSLVSAGSFSVLPHLQMWELDFEKIAWR